MFKLESVCQENLFNYSEYKELFENDFKKYQSRIYPSKNSHYLRWYHIKSDNRYIGAIWLERNANEEFAVLGIFIAYSDFRNKGIGKSAIKQIIENDLKFMDTQRILLHVREENKRAISCYKKIGFTETRRYLKNKFNVIEMAYEVKLNNE